MKEKKWIEYHENVKLDLVSGKTVIKSVLNSQ